MTKLGFELGPPDFPITVLYQVYVFDQAWLWVRGSQPSWWISALRMTPFGPSPSVPMTDVWVEGAVFTLLSQFPL